MQFLVSMLLLCSLCEGLLHDTPQRRQVPLAAAELQSTHDEARRAMISNAVGFGVLSLLTPMANAADSKVSTSLAAILFLVKIHFELVVSINNLVRRPCQRNIAREQRHWAIWMIRLLFLEKRTKSCRRVLSMPI
jgi:hypothetical protein